MDGLAGSASHAVEGFAQETLEVFHHRFGDGGLGLDPQLVDPLRGVPQPDMQRVVDRRMDRTVEEQAAAPLHP